MHGMFFLGRNFVSGRFAQQDTCSNEHGVFPMPL